jgi:hypothetical protein
MTRTLMIETRVREGFHRFPSARFNSANTSRSESANPRWR